MIFPNHRFMRLLEKFLLLVLAVSVAFWFLRFPFGVLLQLTAVMGLALLYLAGLGRLVRSGESKASLGVGGWLLRIGFAFSAVAFLFWFQTWNTAWIYVCIGLLLTAGGCLLLKQPLQESASWMPVWSRAAFWVGLMVVVALIPPHTHISLKYADDPQYLEAYLNWLDNRDSQESYDNWRMHHCRKYPLSCGYVE